MASPFRESKPIVCFAVAALFAVTAPTSADDRDDASASAAPAVTDLAQLPERAEQQIAALLAEKESRTPAQRKISSSLLYMSSKARSALLPAKVPGLRSLLTKRFDRRVDVSILAPFSKALVEAIEAKGGELLSATGKDGTLTARVPIKALEQIAARPEVRHIYPRLLAITQRSMDERAESVRRQLRSAVERLTTPPASTDEGGQTNVGSVTSQGDTAHEAEAARHFFGVDGTGIKVGVLSDSDDFKEASIASGDLPADTVTVPGQDGRPGSGEGTAMMEIVHDLAPGAKLFFATAFNSPESFADNIRTLRFTYGCDIIVDDVIYFYESPYQDDNIAQAVDDVTADGALYFSSAGNQGHFDAGTSGTWEGAFKKGKSALSAIPAGYELHNFGQGQISDRIELAGGPLILHWSDPGSLDNPHSSNDYDLFVLTPDLQNVVVASTDIQDGDDLPFEFLGYLIPANYRVVIAKKVGAANRTVRTLLFGGELALSTAGATYGHAAAKTAFGVAAVDVAQAAGGAFQEGAQTQVELYSADGNRRIFYDRDGNPLNGDKGELRQKPDLSAADGVSTTLPAASGLNPFFGTSAAAPHAAAIAALLKSGKPTLTPGQMRQFLTSSALDIEAANRDRDSGFGIVDAMAALTKARVKPKPFLELSAVNASEAPGDGDGSIEPGESAALDVQLRNVGGAAPQRLTGLVTSSTPGITVTNATSTYPSIPPGGAVGSNATPFAFAVSPSFTCGATANFDLVASYTNGGPASLPFSVQTGRPSPSATTIGYVGAPVAIPDNSSAGVNIPLVVSGGGAISKIRFSIDGATCNTTVGSTTVGISHSWVGDVVVKLTSPSGTTVTLINRAGGTGNSGNNFCQTLLEDDATDSIQGVLISQAPFVGSFKPANPLSAFIGEASAGTWTLNVSDLASIDTGSVRSFSLLINGFTCD